MKFYVIAMMTFLLSLSIAIIQEVDVMSGYSVPYQSDWISEIGSNNYQGQSYDNAPFEANEQNDGNIFTDIRVALTIITKSLYYATVGFSHMLTNFGVPTGLAILFSLPIWIIYALFLAQLLRGQGFEGMR